MTPIPALSQEIRQTIDMYSHHLKSHTFYITKKKIQQNEKGAYFSDLYAETQETYVMYTYT